MDVRALVEILKSFYHKFLNLPSSFIYTLEVRRIKKENHLKTKVETVQKGGGRGTWQRYEPNPRTCQLHLSGLEAFNSRSSGGAPLFLLHYTPIVLHIWRHHFLYTFVVVQTSNLSVPYPWTEILTRKYLTHTRARARGIFGGDTDSDVMSDLRVCFTLGDSLQFWRGMNATFQTFRADLSLYCVWVET